MRYFLAVLLLSFCSVNLQAQDTLYKQDGSRTVVNILEIRQAEVKYKFYSKPDGPVFILNKNYISKIVRPNGEVISFPVYEDRTDQNSYNTSFIRRNIISLNVSDFFVGMITVNYEHSLKSGKISLKIPLSSGFHTLSGTHNDYSFDTYLPVTTIVGTGIELSFYPAGHRQVDYFIGPSLQYRLFNAEYGYYDPVSSIYSVKKSTGTFTGFFIQNGVFFQTGPNLALSLELGLGYVNITDTDRPYGGIRMNFRTNIGFKF